MWASGVEYIPPTSSCLRNGERRSNAYLASSPIDAFNTATTKVRKPWTEAKSAECGILDIESIRTLVAQTPGF